MKMLWVAVAGLVLGVAAGTGWSAVRTKTEILSARAAEKPKTAPRPGGEGHGATDETAVPPLDAPAADSSLAGDTAVAEPPDSSGVPAVVLPTDVSAVEDSLGAPGQADPAAAMIGVAGVAGEGARRLGKIFGAMRPADAAGVLGRMTDAEAAAVLLEMSDRQAAPIVGSLPPDRAAVVGRLVLAGRGGAR
jgi:hypothetical protein